MINDRSNNSLIGKPCSGKSGRPLLVKVRGYLINRELGLFNGLFSSIIGINLGVGAVPSPERRIIIVLMAYLVYGFFLWHGLYFLNDLYDFQEDSRHPEKQTRPLVSGMLTKSDVCVIVVVHLTIALLLAPLISWMMFWISIATILQQVLYCIPPFRLKRYLYWGAIFAGPLGWILRVFVGWTLFRPLAQAPVALCVFVFTFTYPLYFYRRIAHQIEISAGTGGNLPNPINPVTLLCFFGSIGLSIFIIFRGPLSIFHLSVFVLLVLVFASIRLTLAKASTKRQESIAKVAVTLISFAYLAVG